MRKLAHLYPNETLRIEETEEISIILSHFEEDLHFTVGTITQLPYLHYPSQIMKEFIDLLDELHIDTRVPYSCNTDAADPAILKVYYSVLLPFYENDKVRKFLTGLVAYTVACGYTFNMQQYLMDYINWANNNVRWSGPINLTVLRCVFDRCMKLIPFMDSTRTALERYLEAAVVLGDTKKAALDVVSLVTCALNTDLERKLNETAVTMLKRKAKQVDDANAEIILRPEANE